MSFLEKLKAALAKFFAGRNGVDNLAYASLWAGLALSVLDLLNRTGLLSILGLALYVYAMFRMLSRNTAKRAEENRRYLQTKSNFETKCRQLWIRLKNWRVYKYFRCPKCRALMRLNRGAGEKTMQCPRCHTTFKKKA